MITIGGGLAKVRGNKFSKPSTKNSEGLDSFYQLEEGDSEDTPHLWPKGYPVSREVTATGPGGRALSLGSDEIPLDDLPTKRDATYLSEDQGRRRRG